MESPQRRDRIHINGGNTTLIGGSGTTRFMRMYQQEPSVPRMPLSPPPPAPAPAPAPAQAQALTFSPSPPPQIVEMTSRLNRPFSPQYPYISSSTANSSASSSPTSSHHTASDQAPSYETSATSYDKSWFRDESKPPSLLSRDSVIVRPVADHHSHRTGDSCQFDTDDWFAQFNGDIDISDDAPKQESLDAAGEIPIFDSAGNSRLFKSLYSVGDVVGDRQMIIFIRHFYCGACQAYVKAITQSINMQTYFTMAIPTSIVVIGCGSPELIRQYKATTQCPFPIFADPSRKIYRHLGMSWSLKIGHKRPDYFKNTVETTWLFEQFRQMAATKGRKKWKSGNWLQIGGEFLFENGQVVWCHRMKNYRNHAEIETLKRVLEI